MKTPRNTSSLASLFPSPAMARLVVFFAVHPRQRFHLRELMRLTRLPSASIQTELRRLVSLGALRREEERGRAFFSADDSHPSWRAWMLLLRACAKPADVLREALVGAQDLDGAFVFGSTARGDARPESDVDVFLIADPSSRSHAERVLSETEMLLGRPVDVLTYGRDELSDRMRSGNAFIQRVLDGPKEWVNGDAGALPQAVAV